MVKFTICIQLSYKYDGQTLQITGWFYERTLAGHKNQHIKLLWFLVEKKIYFMDVQSEFYSGLHYFTVLVKARAIH